VVKSFADVIEGLHHPFSADIYAIALEVIEMLVYLVFTDFKKVAKIFYSIVLIIQIIPHILAIYDDMFGEDAAISRQESSFT
jgi:hypothetical protein